MADVRVGSGIDVHAFSGDLGRPLVLGGVAVDDAAGLAGHSDADVVAHAVTDALLGALAAGDMGSRFGIAQPELEDAESMALLRSVAADAATAQWSLSNLDVTVVAQRPRLADHREAMRVSLAAALSCDVGVVSVKVTSTDALGSIGRGEGIACWAVCLLTRG